MSQLIGTNPEQVSTNGMLGRMAFQNPEAFVLEPAAIANPVRIGSVVFEFPSNTQLVVKAMGTDGIVRSNTFTLT